MLGLSCSPKLAESGIQISTAKLGAWLATRVIMSCCAAPHNRSCTYQDPDYEDHIKAAIEGLGNKKYSGIREASQKEQVSNQLTWHFGPF